MTLVFMHRSASLLSLDLGCPRETMADGIPANVDEWQDYFKRSFSQGEIRPPTHEKSLDHGEESRRGLHTLVPVLAEHPARPRENAHLRGWAGLAVFPLRCVASFAGTCIPSPITSLKSALQNSPEVAARRLANANAGAGRDSHSQEFIMVHFWDTL